MIIRNIEDLAAALPAGTRLLGLDVGEKTVGLAISDSRFTVASPLKTLRRTKFTADAHTLFALMDEREVGGLVIGLPINMDGSEGQRAHAVRQFADNLMRLRDVPAGFWDERLSTAAVERAMLAADLSRAKRAKHIDAAAAAYILQGALDALARLRP